jgi:hypothetical protein
MVVAAARAIGGAWPAFLIAWAARGLLETIQPILRMAHIWPAHPGLDPAQLTFNFAMGAVLAAVSGLLIRWLLEPKPTPPRPDLRLAGYVAMIVAWNIISSGVIRVLQPDPHILSQGDAVLRAVRSGGALIGLQLVAAALALWPISMLLGERLSPVRAVRLMGQAYGSFVLAMILLILPGVLLTPLQFVLHHRPNFGADRLWIVGIGSLSTTASAVVLAQVYSRRLRGVDLAASGSSDGPRAWAS